MFNRSTSVHLPVSGRRGCRCVVNDGVLQRNEEFAVRHRRSSEPAVQQAFWHQFLDCEHLLLVSDLAQSDLKLVHLVGERPEDGINLFRIPCSVRLGDVADQCSSAEFLSDIFL